MIDPLSVNAVPHGHAAPLNADVDENAVQQTNAATTVIRTAQPQNTASERPPQHTKSPFAAQYDHESSSLDKALEQLNESMQAWSTGVRFDIDPDTQRIVLTLVDNESGDVIRTVPSEAVMAVAKMIAQFQGNGINTKA
ncbi:MAG TPA: flagellar protein FlaG [Paenalcaligenes sp.]|nr:flagellar protein FlaG [Paenalcaligenes sp.]